MRRAESGALAEGRSDGSWLSRSSVFAVLVRKESDTRREAQSRGGSMSKIHLVCASAAIFGLGGSAWAADTPPANTPAMHHAASAKDAKSAPTDEELIASAMKAAPKKVAEDATIVAPDPKGGMRTLRKGSNG